MIYKIAYIYIHIHIKMLLDVIYIYIYIICDSSIPTRNGLGLRCFTLVPSQVWGWSFTLRHANTSKEMDPVEAMKFWMQVTKSEVWTWTLSVCPQLLRHLKIIYTEIYACGISKPDWVSRRSRLVDLRRITTQSWRSSPRSAPLRRWLEHQRWAYGWRYWWMNLEGIGCMYNDTDSMVVP